MFSLYTLFNSILPILDTLLRGTNGDETYMSIEPLSRLDNFIIGAIEMLMAFGIIVISLIVPMAVVYFLFNLYKRF